MTLRKPSAGTKCQYICAGSHMTARLPRNGRPASSFLSGSRYDVTEGFACAPLGNVPPRSVASAGWSKTCLSGQTRINFRSTDRPVSLITRTQQRQWRPTFFFSHSAAAGRYGHHSPYPDTLAEGDTSRSAARELDDPPHPRHISLFFPSRVRL